MLVTMRRLLGQETVVKEVVVVVVGVVADRLAASSRSLPWGRVAKREEGPAGRVGGRGGKRSGVDGGSR